MNQAERREKIELYARGYDLLISALAEIPRSAWDFKPTSRDWNIHEIIIHLADSEAVSALRLRKMVVEPGTPFMTYDETQWADVLAYRDQNIEDALQSVKFTRLTTSSIQKSLADEVFSHTSLRADNSEPLTIDRWLAIYSNHIPNHINQMMDAFKAWKEAQK